MKLRIITEMPLIYRDELRPDAEYKSAWKAQPHPNSDEYDPEDTDVKLVPRDRRLLQKAKPVLFKAFARSKYTWIVVIRDDTDKERPQPTPGAITYILDRSPLEGRADPMTPWMVAHRIGHTSIEDNYSHQQKMNELIEKIGTGLAPESDPYVALARYCTFKSARDNNVIGNEVVFELVAQYLMTGKITLRRPAARYTTHLTNAFDDIFDNCVGKVLYDYGE